ncbi:MAG: 30S ribosomal protein S6 [Fibrobacter sp.]|nr:30S ribosomal protein S6 [Fibrobacter sp.]
MSERPKGIIMRNYEMMVIVDAMISDDAIEAELQGIEDKINARAKLVRKDDWGKRKLAYEINRRTHGYYAIYYYETEDVDLSKDIEDEFRINPNVIRWMTLVDHPMTDKEYNGEVSEVAPPTEDDDEEIGD